VSDRPSLPEGGTRIPHSCIYTLNTTYSEFWARVTNSECPPEQSFCRRIKFSSALRFTASNEICHRGLEESDFLEAESAAVDCAADLAPMVSVGTLAHAFDMTARRVEQLTAEGVLPKAERGRYPLTPAVRVSVAHLKGTPEVPSGRGGRTMAPAGGGLSPQPLSDRTWPGALSERGSMRWR